MKRHGNLFEKIASKEVLEQAYHNAKKGKSHYREVKRMEANLTPYITHLQETLLSGKYRTSEYEVFERIEGHKLRVIQSLPFYPDRIVHHAIMIVCGGFWRKSLIRDTFQSLPGRGTSDARKRVNRHRDNYQPKYFAQLDVKKFYPSVSHALVKRTCVDKFIKCRRTKDLLYEIIESITGLPIGSFLSQIWGNLCLSGLDWFVKGELRIKGYFRYCDDLVITGNCKALLREQVFCIINKVAELGLKIKPDWKLQSLLFHGIDFCGYVFMSDTTKLRKRIKESFKNKLKENDLKGIMSYWGWIKPLPDKNLWRHYEVINENAI